MSRIGKQPIKVPAGVEVKADGCSFRVKGKLGELSCVIPPTISYTIEEGLITFTRKSDRPQHRSDHGLSRALVNNLVVGVTEGFEKKLELEGTGYKWEVRGKEVVMIVGFSHPVQIPIPEGVNVEIGGIRCRVFGADKQQVGFLAAQIFKAKPVEPYKGKGVHYEGQYIRRKAGKAGA